MFSSYLTVRHIPSQAWILILSINFESFRFLTWIYNTWWKAEVIVLIFFINWPGWSSGTAAPRCSTRSCTACWAIPSGPPSPSSSRRGRRWPGPSSLYSGAGVNFFSCGYILFLVFDTYCHLSCTSRSFSFFTPQGSKNHSDRKLYFPILAVDHVFLLTPCFVFIFSCFA